MRAVIFDMDGLMFDTERIYYQAGDYAGEKMGIGKAGFMALKTLGMNGEMSRRVWRQEFGENYNEQELRVYCKEFVTDYFANHPVPVKEGLYPLLDFLQKRNVKLAVASSTKTPEVMERLESTNVKKYFQAVIGGEQVKLTKPDPEIFQMTAKALGENTENCFVLEDSKSGLISARDAGCKAIMVPDLWQPDEEVRGFATGIFKDLNEVMEYFIQNRFF